MKRIVENKFVLVFVLLLLSGTSMAQSRWSVKPMAGGVLSTYVGENTKEFKQRMGWMAGAEVGYSVSQPLRFSLGLAYTQQGCVLDKDQRLVWKGIARITAAREDFYLRTKYFSVPLLAEYYVAKGLALKTGIQANFLHHATEEYTVRIDDNILDGEPINEWNDMSKIYYEDRNYNWKSKMNSVDITIPIGLSYEYAGVVVDARYHLGLSHSLGDSVHFYTDTDSSPKNARTSMLTLTLGYRFEL